MADIRQDPHNANKGTVRGRGMVEHSLQHYGAGRSILVDKHGVIVAGNKTAEIAQELGIPIQTIESDGRTLYAIKRTDLDLATDAAAKELGIVDNRSSEVGLEWAPEVLAALADDGVDLSQFWFEPELDRLLMSGEDVPEFDAEAEWRGMPEYETEDKRPKAQLTVYFSSENDKASFGELIGQGVTANTKWVWHPPIEPPPAVRWAEE